MTSVFIGLGGAWRTPHDLAFFCAYHQPHARLRLVDGGVYEARQRDHEHFLTPGNKARVQARMLRDHFPGLAIEAIPKYVGTTPDSVRVADVIPDGGVVFLQVDNNHTRKLVSDHATTLENVTVLCGGTEGDQLRVLVHLRRDGQDLTPPLTVQCRAIREPDDESPLDRRGCVEQLGEHHHPFTMLTTSTMLANAFYMVWQRENDGGLAAFPYQELWFDIGTGRCRTEPLTNGGSNHGHYRAWR